MRKLAVQLLALALFIGNRPALAAETSASDSCTEGFTKLVNAMQAECSSHSDAKKQRLEILKTYTPGKDPPDAGKDATLKELNESIAKLERERPLLARGLCTATPRNCNELASVVSISLDPVRADLASSLAAPRTAQAQAVANEVAASDRQTSNNKSGSSAQIDPVESIQPITLAGGAVALSGTRSGTKGVGVITVNPLALAAPNDAVAGRILDISVSAPFDLQHGTGEDRRYVSLRVRANLTAPISASRLRAKVSEWVAAEGRHADSIEDVLAHAQDVVACAEVIARTGQPSKAACGEELDAADVAKARAAAYAEMDDARRAADKYYLGIDARLDTGDPTGPEVAGDKGTHLLGGLASGVRLSQSQRWDWELRGRFAGDYFDSRDDSLGARPSPVYSLDWGAAFIFSGRLENHAKQRMAFGVGVEGRQAVSDKTDASQTPTNFANLNLMTVVPAISGADLGLAVSIPLAEDGVKRGALISLSTDLGLLDHSAN
jgi:hypothetical protein